MSWTKISMHIASSSTPTMCWPPADLLCSRCINYHHLFTNPTASCLYFQQSVCRACCVARPQAIFQSLFLTYGFETRRVSRMWSKPRAICINSSMGVASQVRNYSWVNCTIYVMVNGKSLVTFLARNALCCFWTVSFEAMSHKTCLASISWGL